MGKPWSTSWFRIEGAVPQEWAGRRVEAVFDPGFSGQGPGFQAEGMLYDAEGSPQGIHPRNRHLTIAAPAAGGEPVGLLLEAAANPSVLEHGFEPTPLGDVLTAGDRPSTPSPAPISPCWTRRSGIWSWISRCCPS
ncbi:hypothetical protein NKH18_41635 [Streptomyces sp. M10(2022)]